MTPGRHTRIVLEENRAMKALGIRRGRDKQARPGKMLLRFRACAAVILLGMTIMVPRVAAHVGSPDVYFQGSAGPYQLIVTVRTPPMIPGVSDVEVLSATPGVSQIKIVPIYIVGPGAKYPPAADVLAQSKDDPQYFSGKIWLMESGSWEVRVQVSGTRGSGEMAVPVPAFARTTLPMQKGLGILLFCLMLLLFAAIVSIMGAARREGALEPGEQPGPVQKRRARIVMAGTGIIFLAVLAFGDSWWNSEARATEAKMIYTPPPLAVSLEPGANLLLQMGDSKWHDDRPDTVMTGLIPDHGYLMHLFLVRLPGMDRFYHLHPNMTADNKFKIALPSIVAGRYQVFADVVRKSGFPDTMVAQIDLPGITGVPLAGDNSSALAPPLMQPVRAQTGDEPVFVLPDGYRMVWERGSGPMPSNQFLWLRFKLEDANGKPATGVEPYMGMAGHAEIVRADRSVFAHIHPDGSVAMAALMLARQTSGLNSSTVSNDSGTSPQDGAMQSMRPVPGMAPQSTAIPPEVAFPYGFPKSGTYRIFVQMRRGSQIETGVFDAAVE
jgi:hypothetical protein